MGISGLAVIPPSHPSISCHVFFVVVCFLFTKRFHIMPQIPFLSTADDDDEDPDKL